jgi:hypothetical protein
MLKDAYQRLQPHAGQTMRPRSVPQLRQTVYDPAF